MITWLLLIIFIEAVTEILVSSILFEKLREWLYTKNDFIGKLIHCGYCTSVWISATVAWLAPLPESINSIMGYFIAVFVLHRLSNIWHEIIARLLGRIPYMISIMRNEREHED